MRQQTCIDLTLEQIVKMIASGKFAIPYFQRDSVWKPVQAGHLADSICRGSPINSITLIPREGKLQIGTRPLDVKGGVLVDNFDYHVLDGQQRLTAIAKVFCNFPDEIPYYFDLFSILVQEFENDNIVLKDPDASLYHKYDVKDCICIQIKEAKNRPETWGNGRFVLGSEFLVGKGMLHIMNFMQTLDIQTSSPKFSQYMNALVALHNIGSYPIVTNHIYDDTPEEEIVAIFLSINQSGVELDLGDLINAQSFKYPHIPNGLRGVFEKDILTVLNKEKGMAGILKKMGYKGKDFNMIPFLNTLYFYDKIMQEDKSWETVPKKDNLFSFGSEKFFDLWALPQKMAFFQSLEWVWVNKWDRVITPTTLQWFAAFCMAEPRILKYQNLLKRFQHILVVCNQLRMMRVSQLKINELIQPFCQALKTALNSNDPDKFNDFPSINNHIQFSPDLILQTNKGLSGLYMLFEHILFNETDHHFTMDLNGNLLDNSKNTARALLFNYPKGTKINGINSLANIIPTSAQQSNIINNDSLSFDIRMKQALAQLGKNKFDEMCHVNMIDYYSYCQDRKMGISEEEAASKALYRRAVRMISYINHYLKGGISA